ncbi:hypothetical protein [Janthinobacterium sp.]|nr:hypothetical protein [Janthinobacterium sp.]
MKIIPTLPEIAKEGILVFCGVLVAALILSRLPKLQAFVEKNSFTVHTK